MKKIYSLLLLSGLMLLGAQNAMADDPTYYYRGDDNSWGATLMTKVGETNTYSYTLSVAAKTESKFKIAKTSSSWEYDDSKIDNTSTYPSNIVLNGVGGNISIYLGFATSVTIFFDADNQKIYAQVPYYDVTIYTDVNYNLHAFDNHNLNERSAHHGYWPGWQSESNSSLNGSTWYEYHVLFPQGQNMTVIFSNNGNYQSSNVSIGTVSQNMTLCYYLAGGVSSAVQVYSYSVRGSFVDDFETIYPFIRGEVTLFNLPSEWYQLKVVEGVNNKWYTNNSENLTPIANSLTMSTEGGSDNNATMHAVVKSDYKFVLDASTKNSPMITISYPTEISRSVAIGSYGTICLPVNATIEGANLYTLTTVGASSVTITPTGDNALIAGTPYIFKATANSQTITLLNTAYAEDPEDKANTNGLQGVYAGQNIETGKYILYEDQICKAGTGVTIGDNRAYFDIVVPAAAAPSAFRIVEGENGATSIDAIEASEKAVKFIENGQLLIKKNGVVYDMMGAIVK